VRPTVTMREDHKAERRLTEVGAVAVICPSKEQQRRLSGGGSSLAVPSEDRWARSRGAARGLPSLAGGEAGPECLHSFHQVQDSTTPPSLPGSGKGGSP